MNLDNPITTFFFDEKKHKKIHKWIHYFDIYHDHFKVIKDIAKKQNRKINILEIGIFYGGSLELWNNYFENVNIYAIDVNPNVKNLISSIPNVKLFIGDQGNREFLRSVISQIPEPIDIVIDDGGHRMNQQIISFEELYPKININSGIYLCEDTHTSYWDEYGGGLKRDKTFIEYAKDLIDKLNAFHCDKIKPDDFTNTTYSITFYDSIVLFTKKQKQPLQTILSGI